MRLVTTWLHIYRILLSRMTLRLRRDYNRRLWRRRRGDNDVNSRSAGSFGTGGGFVKYAKTASCHRTVFQA